jgi:hypothetical protein
LRKVLLTISRSFKSHFGLFSISVDLCREAVGGRPDTAYAIFDDGALLGRSMVMMMVVLVVADMVVGMVGVHGWA